MLLFSIIVDMSGATTGEDSVAPVPVVVVGQTPPPWGGQALMIKAMLENTHERVCIVHIPMRFSTSMGEMGKLRVRKFLHLLEVVASIVFARFRYGGKVLYYPPAGPSRAAVWRDLVILIVTRWMFPRTIFHFHAAGLSQLYPHLLRVERWLFRLAYFRPDVAIKTARSAPDDPIFIGARREIVVYNGVEDAASTATSRPRRRKGDVLYVGLLGRSKGVMVLLEAAAGLTAEGQHLAIDLVGEFESAAFEAEVRRYVDERLPGKVAFHGVLTGNDKWAMYGSTDIFCYPSFFESESSGVVLIEAMQFGLPLVASDWRGIRDLVRNEENGLLVPPRDSRRLGNAINRLLTDSDLRERYGKRSRQIYEQNFTLDHFRAGMQQVFDAAITDL